MAYEHAKTQLRCAMVKAVIGEKPNKAKVTAAARLLCRRRKWNRRKKPSAEAATKAAQFLNSFGNARERATRGGRAKSERKTIAARLNGLRRPREGKHRGRPRKAEQVADDQPHRVAADAVLADVQPLRLGPDNPKGELFT